MEAVTKVILIVGVFCHDVQSVQETIHYYNCVKGPNTITYKTVSEATNCDQTWTLFHKPIGTLINGSVQCLHPCSQLTPSGIVVSDCVNITLTVLCAEKYVTEHRVHFYGKEMPLPLKTGNHRTYYGDLACLGVLLALALIVLLLRCRTRRHGSRGADNV